MLDESMMMKWDNYFMGIAHEVGKNSKCYSRKIGSILVKDKSIISTGYNGPPRGIPHCENRNSNSEEVCPRQLMGYKSGEGLSFCISGHSESNCIVNAARMGICTKGTTLYCDCGIPCKDCMILLINAGISEIVYNKSKYKEYERYVTPTLKYLVKHCEINIRGLLWKD